MSGAAAGIAFEVKRRVRRADGGRKKTSFVAALLAQGLLIGLVSATPWLLGGVEPVVQLGLFVGVALAMVCWLVKLFADRPMTAVLPVAVIPLGAALGLGLLQLLPLNSRINALLSPAGARLRTSLLSSQLSADVSLAETLGVAAMGDRQPLSLYPASTRRDLALLTLAVAVFVLGAAVFKTARAQFWLCTLIAVNGAALAFFGFVQQLTWKGLLYWTIPLLGGGAPFGSFVNRNNAGGFLNLCLAGAVGMTIWAFGRRGSSGFAPERFPRQDKRGLLREAGYQLRDFVAHLNASRVIAMSLTGCIVAGILCSLSRGAFLAMTGATALTVLVVFCVQRRAVGGWRIALVAMAGLGLVSWVGMSDAVQARLATLLNQETLERARIPHWKDGLKAAADFWPLGSGLGTYRYVYGQYQQEPNPGWFYHAENQCLEAVVEGGVLGLGLMLTMVALVGVACWRLLRHARDTRSFAFATAGIFAPTGQAIANFFDFGLYAPANMVLLALLCGALSGGAAELANRGWLSWLLALPRVRLLAPVVGVALLAATIFGCLEIRRVAAVETVLKEIRFTQSPTENSPQTVVQYIQQLAAAAEHRKDDAEAQYTLARLWISLYRLRAFEQLREAAPPDADGSSLWQVTSPMVIQRRSHQFVQNDLLSELEELRSEPVVRDYLRPALKHLILARRACPLLPDVHVLIAQLCGLVVDPATDQVHLERARRLAPSDPDLLFQVGLLEFQAERPDRAYDSWRESLALSSAHLDVILGIVDEQLETPGVIEKVLPPAPGLLVQLAQKRYLAEEQAGVRRLLVQRAEQLVERIGLPEEEQCHLRGAIFALQERYLEAIANYTRAVQLRFQEVGWRYELALLLRQQGRLEEARKQARLCARMDPDKRAYRTLLEEINHAQLTTAAPLE